MEQLRRECERRFRLLRAMLDDRRYIGDPGAFFHALRATVDCDDPRLGFRPGFDAVRQKVLGDLSGTAEKREDDVVGKRKAAQVLFHHHYWLAREVTKRLSVWDRLRSLVP